MEAGPGVATDTLSLGLAPAGKSVARFTRLHEVQMSRIAQARVMAFIPDSSEKVGATYQSNLVVTARSFNKSLAAFASEMAVPPGALITAASCSL